MNINELSGADLDLEVAKCEGGVFHMRQYSGVNPGPEFPAIQWRYDWQELCNYTPSTDWEQGGPIIEREGITVSKEKGGWSAYFRDNLFEDDGSEHWQTGPTPLIAAMRCYVASKQGESNE